MAAGLLPLVVALGKQGDDRAMKAAPNDREE